MKLRKALAWVVFAAEVLVVAVTSYLFIFFFLATLRYGFSWRATIVLIAGAYGLGTLRWMLVKYGPMMKKDPPAMNLVVWLGWAAGVCLAISLIISSSLQERSWELGLQMLGYFGSLVAISLHMLISYKRARKRNEEK